MKVFIFFVALAVVSARHNRKQESTAAVVHEVLKQLSQQTYPVPRPISSLGLSDKPFVDQNSQHFTYFSSPPTVTQASRQKQESTAAVVHEVLKQLSQQTFPVPIPISSLGLSDKPFLDQNPQHFKFFSSPPTVTQVSRQILQETNKEQLTGSDEQFKQNLAGQQLQKSDWEDDVVFELQKTIEIGDRAQSVTQQMWSQQGAPNEAGRIAAQFTAEVQQLIIETDILQTKRVLDQAQNNVRQLQLQRQFINQQQDKVQAFLTTINEAGVPLPQLKDLTVAALLLQKQEKDLVAQELRQLRTVQQLQQMLIEQESEVQQKIVAQQLVERNIL